MTWLRLNLHETVTQKRTVIAAQCELDRWDLPAMLVYNTAGPFRHFSKSAPAWGHPFCKDRWAVLNKIDEECPENRVQGKDTKSDRKWTRHFLLPPNTQLRWVTCQGEASFPLAAAHVDVKS